MARPRLIRGLALVFPPVTVLASVHELYLRNQQDLDQTLSVLLPFWAAAAAAVLLGAFLQRLDGAAPARAALWAYYGLGFGFTAWSFLRAQPAFDQLALWTLDTAAGAAVFAGAWLALVVAASRRAQPRALEPLVATLAVVLAAREMTLLVSALDRAPRPPARDVAEDFGAGGSSRLPNVYHLILDAFQDELFEPCLPAGAEAVFDGFVRFHVATPGRATVRVLPTIFTGRALDAGGQKERLREGLLGASSLLGDLRRGGYRTVGFVPRYVYADHSASLDLAVFHDDNVKAADVRALHGAAFRRLWAFRVLPLALTERLARGHALGFDAEFLRSAQAQRLSAYAQPIVSRLSFESVLEAEARLPARGRYTLVHLLLPHDPFLLRSDCGYGTASNPTDLRQQTDCTLRLVVRYLGRLQELGRLEPSVVVVHGDHGSGAVLRDGRLVADDSAYYRTLLLVKGAAARGPLRQGSEPATAADIAPTLAALLGLSHAGAFDGRPLGEALR